MTMQMNDLSVMLEQLRHQRVADTIEIFLLAESLVFEPILVSTIAQDYERFKHIIGSYPEVLDTAVTDFFIELARGRIQDHLRGEGTNCSAGIVESICTLNRILAGYCLASGLEGTFRCTFQKRQLVLPHAGICIFTIDNTGSHELVVSQGNLLINGKSVLEGVSNTFQTISLPSVEFSGRKIFINREDPAYLSWCESDPFKGLTGPCLVSRKELPRWMHRLESVHHLFQRFWPEMGEMIALLVHDIVPLVQPTSEGESLSTSSSMRIGAVMGSIVPSEELGEMLIHEFAHNILNIVTRFERLVEKHGNSEAKYYSPLRSDPRPISGVLHAFHSLMHMAQYYKHLGQDKRYELSMSEVFTSTLIKARICSLTLQSCDRFTSEGEKLFHTMIAQVDELMTSPMWRPTDEVVAPHNEHLNAAKENGIDMSWMHGKSLTTLLQILPWKSGQDQAEEMATDDQCKSLSFPSSAADEFFFNDSPVQLPVIFRSLRIFDEEFLTPSTLLEKFGAELVSCLEINKHKGFEDTPSTQMTLSDLYVKKSDIGKPEYYLGVQPINHWPAVMESVKVWGVLNRFFLDNNTLLFFRNDPGTTVLLHQDSSNNLHFNLWGKKTFFLCPPQHSVKVYDSSDGYREGFSPINPFLTRERLFSTYPNFAIEIGSFVTINAGDCLFIPKNWWHAVKYDEDSASVTCWDRYSRKF